jgi:hemoglobin
MRILIIGALVAACGGASKPPATDTRPLFVRLGGQPAINAVVHEFVLATKADNRINQYFMNTDPVKLEQAMDDHVCSITGGGCTYKGKSMTEAHTGMKLREPDFAAFIEDLQAVLDKLKVPARESGEVIAAFRGMQGEVVGH